jgi:hypothetical protein
MWRARSDAQIAFADLRHLADWNAESAVFKDAASIPDEIAAAIALVAELDAADAAPGDDKKLRIKLFDKLKALEALARLTDPRWNPDVLTAPTPLPNRVH